VSCICASACVHMFVLKSPVDSRGDIILCWMVDGWRAYARCSCDSPTVTPIHPPVELQLQHVRVQVLDEEGVGVHHVLFRGRAKLGSVRHVAGRGCVEVGHARRECWGGTWDLEWRHTEETGWDGPWDGVCWGGSCRESALM